MDKQYTVFYLDSIAQMDVQLLLLDAGVNPGDVKFDTIADVPQGILKFMDRYEDAEPQQRHAFVRVTNVPANLVDVPFEPDARFANVTPAQRITFEVFRILRDELNPADGDDDGTEFARAIGGIFTDEELNAHLLPLAKSFPNALEFQPMTPGKDTYRVMRSEIHVEGKHDHTDYTIMRVAQDGVSKPDVLDVRFVSPQGLEQMRTAKDAGGMQLLPHPMIRNRAGEQFLIYNNQGNYLFGCLTMDAHFAYLRSVLDGFVPDTFDLETLSFEILPV